MVKTSKRLVWTYCLAALFVLFGGSLAVLNRDDGADVALGVAMVVTGVVVALLTPGEKR